MGRSGGGEERLVAMGFCLGSMTSVQLGAALSERVFDRLSPSGVVALRLLFAGLVLLAATRPRLRTRPRREVAAVFVLGAVTGALTLCFFEAISRIPLGIASAIEFLGPLTVALVGSRTRRDVLWIALAAAGVAIFALGSPVHGSLDPAGVAFALAAALGWGLYIVLTQRVGGTFPGLQGLAISIATAAIVTLPFAIAVDGTRLATPGLLPIMVGLSILVPLLPFALEMAALRRLSSHVFGLLMSLEPVIGAIFGFLIIHQRIRPAGLVAIALIVTASAGTTASQLRQDVIVPPVPPG